MVGTLWRSGPLEYHRSRYLECAEASGLDPFGSPLIATSAQPSTGLAPRMTAVGMLFAPGVQRVRITLADGSRQTIRLSLPTADGVTTTAAMSFRYAAFAVHGVWCAERLVSLGPGGRALWDSGANPYACGSEGEPEFSRALANAQP